MINLKNTFSAEKNTFLIKLGGTVSAHQMPEGFKLDPGNKLWRMRY